MRAPARKLVQVNTLEELEVILNWIPPLLRNKRYSLPVFIYMEDGEYVGWDPISVQQETPELFAGRDWPLFSVDKYLESLQKPQEVYPEFSRIKFVE